MAVSIRGTRNALEHRLYSWAAIAALLVVFAGFARTFYLKLLFDTPALSMLQQAHGLVMTAWFALFVVQTQLVASGRTDLHRRVGVFGALLALAVPIMGTTTAIVGARLGHTPGPPPLMFLTVPLGDMLVFVVLVGCALWFRRRTDIHKRLMLLSCVGLLTAAIARIPLEIVQRGKIVEAFLLTLAGVGACIAWDTARHRRLHPAFAWGGMLILVSWPARLLLMGTPQWMQFAKWLTS